MKSLLPARDELKAWMQMTFVPVTRNEAGFGVTLSTMGSGSASAAREVPLYATSPACILYRATSTPLIQAIYPSAQKALNVMMLTSAVLVMTKDLRRKMQVYPP